MKFDTIIIGGGLSGMISAIVSKIHQPQKKIAIITFGAGSTPMMSGTIDFLSFINRKYIPSPDAGIAELSEDHPYRKIGLETIRRAVDWFKKFTAERSLPYDGDLNHQLPVITTLGTIKPACLAQTSMDASPIKFSNKIVVVGLKNFKDFSSKVAAEKLQDRFRDKTVEAVDIDLISADGRDPLLMDAARFLDTDEGIRKFVELVKNRVEPKILFVTPPIFGTRGMSSHNAAESQLGATIIETTCIPPSPPGMRLQNLFLEAVEDLDIDLFEHMKIIESTVENNRAVSITTSSKKVFEADRFVLATGNFFGGGIDMKSFTEPVENIFNLPVYFESDENSWTNENFFESQGFARTGILVDENLHSIILDNVQIIGKNLGGFDLTTEGSSSGVALTSAYKAGIFDD